MIKHKFIFTELPMSQVERDPNQPRKDFGTEGEKNKLKKSIEKYGIEEPLKVSEISENRYIIMDGHRRYICAQGLGLKVIPCRIYPKMPEGEFETRRYEMQNNRRAWNALERSDALERIKNSMGLVTNHEVADYLGMSKTSVQLALQMRKQRIMYLSLMERHQLPSGLRFALIILIGKLRRIKKIEVDDIVLIIFKKIEHKVIVRAPEIQKLGMIFMHATLAEEEINNFLTRIPMTVSELEQRTRQTGFVMLIGDLMEKITQKRKNGISFTKGEKLSLVHLATLLSKAI